MPDVRVLDLDETVLRDFVRGRKQAVREKKKEGTWTEGHRSGINDALKRLVPVGALPFMGNMAIVGFSCRYDKSTDPKYKKSDADSYANGYDGGLCGMIQILTRKDTT